MKTPLMNGIGITVRKCFLLVFLSTLLSAHGLAQVRKAAASPVPPVPGPVVLDLKAGSLLGAAIGMDEAATRKALIHAHLPRINKIQYPTHFGLQACQSIDFNFRGGAELDDIYTNSDKVKLSNGLKLGQPLKDFTARLGAPATTRRLPSNQGDEVVYQVGPFDLAVICMDTNKEVAAALSFRKHGVL